MKYSAIIFIAGLILFTPAATAPEPAELSYNGKDMMAWTLTGKEGAIIEYQGKEAFQIKGGPGDAFAYDPSKKFRNFVLEADIAAVPSYTGIVFRAQDEHTYEAVYFRPQNSGHPDPVFQKRTVQYIFHPDNTWSYLRQNFPGKYESSADLDVLQWFHVRLVVEGTRASVYVNGSEEPVLVIPELLQGETEGWAGVWCGNLSGGIFSNVTIRSMPALK